MSAIALIDYGAGNLHSVHNALKAAGAVDIAVTADPDIVRKADRIVLPGVGAFGACAAGLASLRGMIQAIEGNVLGTGAPFLGICVGMQLMAERGDEHGEHQGLGWFDGVVQRLEPTNASAKVPHMGWNVVQPTVDHPLIVPGEAYFLHSFAYEGDGVIATTDHGGPVTAAIGHGNIIGVQFHPEKSQRYGIAFLERFLKMAALIVFPAIDLKAGQVVRLAEGDMDRATIYGDDPAAQAEAFHQAGAEWLHVVDLDGAFAGESVNGAAVASILETFGGKIQLGGGIRTRELIERWLDLGVERVVIGTAALENPALVREAARSNPGRIVVAVDARDGLVATRGWAEVSDVAVVDLARRFEDAGVAALLFTDVGRDGMLKGCNVEATVALARAVSIPVIASGGVTDIGDVHALAKHVEDGVEGVITGRALYDGRLDLGWAIQVAKG